MTIPASSTASTIKKIARPWGNATDMDALIDWIGDTKHVLLGEASHGTHEYYLWRSLISQRLIAEKGFSFIAVEGSWSDCYQLNRYVKHYANAGNNAQTVLRNLERWPSWVWANHETAQLAEWLHDYNSSHSAEARVGFYGLDAYNLWDSMRVAIQYLTQVDPRAAQTAQEAYRCFEPYSGNANTYARLQTFVPQLHEAGVIRALQALHTAEPPSSDYEAPLSAEQNTRTAAHAKRYYHTLFRGDADSWNIRDRHMMNTLKQLTRWHGRSAKTIVWAHNTHVGDARYTDMYRAGMVNLGQLVRQTHGEDNVALIGFGSYEGKVVASRYWDAPMEIMAVPPAPSGTWESDLHAAMPGDKMILSEEIGNRGELWRLKGHRAIGVVYNPEHDRANYVPTLLPSRYDAFIYLDHTQALRPLHLPQIKDTDYSETFPWGV